MDKEYIDYKGMIIVTEAETGNEDRLCAQDIIDMEAKITSLEQQLSDLSKRESEIKAETIKEMLDNIDVIDGGEVSYYVQVVTKTDLESYANNLIKENKGE